MPISNPGGASSWKYITGYTVSGASASAITITGLLGNSYKAFVVILRAINGAGAATDCQVRLNNDSANNYTTNYLECTGAAATGNTTGAYSAIGGIGYMNTGQTGNMILWIYTPSGYERIYQGIGGSKTLTKHGNGVWSNTADEITRIDLIGSANIFAVGSSVQIYGVV